MDSVCVCGREREPSHSSLPHPHVGPADTHMALDGEDLGSKLLDAHVEVSDLTAATLEAVPKLS